MGSGRRRGLSRIFGVSPLARADDPWAFEDAGMRGRSDGRIPVVLRSKERGILARRLLVLDLKMRGSDMRLLGGGQFFLCRLRRGSARPTIVADVVRRIVNDGLIVDVGDVDVRDVVDRAIVEIRAVVPVPALEADARIAKAVAYAAVKAHVRAPISSIEDIGAVVPAPISRRPEQPRTWSLRPGARHPVIVDPAPRPITWRPNVARGRKRRLSINGQGGGRDIDADADRDLRVGAGGKRDQR